MQIVRSAGHIKRALPLRHDGLAGVNSVTPHSYFNLGLIFYFTINHFQKIITCRLFEQKIRKKNLNVITPTSLILWR